MERKNTILLTVIAIATLLVAVVGATFAYFTATFTPQNANNNKAEAKSKTFVNTTFDYGNKAVADSTVVPGYKILKKMTVTGSGDNDAEPAKIQITMTPTIPDGMTGKIKYTIYKVDDSTTAEAHGDLVTCTESQVQSTVVGNEVHYSDNMTCTASAGATEYTDPTTTTQYKDKVFENSKPVTVTINNITGSTVSTYYLVIEFVNDGTATQTGQGQTYSVTLDAKPIA